MNQLSPPIRRLLAIALLVFFGAGLWSFGVAPVIGAFADYDQAIARDRELLARYRAIAAERAGWEQRLAELAQRAGEGGFLEAAEPALAAASLQNQVKRFLSAAGGSVQSLQGLPVAEEGEYRRVAMRVILTCDIDGLHKALHAIESADPYLFVQEVTIRPTAPAGRQRPAGEAMLQVVLTVYGYAKPAAA